MKPTTEILYASLLRRVAIKVKTDALLMKINTGLDRIHDEAIARFKSLAKSTGQRMRADRL